MHKLLDGLAWLPWRRLEAVGARGGRAERGGAARGVRALPLTPLEQGRSPKGPIGYLLHRRALPRLLDAHTDFPPQELTPTPTQPSPQP